MAKTVAVTNAAELYEALANAVGGETILLSSGSYGSLWLSAKSGFDITFPSTVTIASANIDEPAIFTRLSLNGAANLSIAGVVFDYTAASGDTQRDMPNEVISSTNISITDSVFDGDVASGSSEYANGFGTGIGLSVRWSSGVTIENNEFFNWHRGAVFDASSDLNIVGNEIYDIRSDGMDFVNVQTVLIEDNYIHDFQSSYSAGDHRDMIQFWTTGTTTPSTDIIIRDNVLDIGDGAYTQSIFMRNEMVDTGQAGTEMYYQNVLIENNTIYNGHLHGITVGETNGLVITGNSVLESKDESNPDDSTSTVWTPTIRVAQNATNVEITANAVATITGATGQADWTVSGNAIVQANNPYADGYYGDVFVSSTLLSTDSVHHFVALPGSTIEALDAGSSETRYATAYDGDALYNVAEVDGNGAARLFDASVMSDLLGADLAGASFAWSFGDGTTARGITVEHSYGAGGDFDVSLVITLADGRKLTAAGDIEVAGSKVVAFDAEAGGFVGYSKDVAKDLGALTNLDGDALQLGAKGTTYTVGRGNLTALKDADDVTINFTLKADTLGSGGELFRVHSSFLASVTSAGQLYFQVFQQDGSTVKLTTKSDVLLNDGASHDVSIDMDGGVLKVTIDGVSVGEVATGNLATSVTDLVFGNPWGKTNFVGDISAFEISIDGDDYVASTNVLNVEPLSAVIEEEAALVEEALADKVVLAAETSVADVAPLDVVAEAFGDTDYTLDLASLFQKTDLLVGDADAGFTSVALRDSDDYINLGRLKSVEASDQVAFSVDFSRAEDSTNDQRLVWNHMKVGLTLGDDSLMVQVATADQGFKAFSIKGLDLNNSDMHNAAVLIDAESDRLQVVLDNEVVLDVTGVDFDIVGAGGREWGWTLGSAWSHDFAGDVYAFSVDTDFAFIEPSAVEANLA
jgi:hypothetical protein